MRSEASHGNVAPAASACFVELFLLEHLRLGMVMSLLECIQLIDELRKNNMLLQFGAQHTTLGSRSPTSVVDRREVYHSIGSRCERA